MALPHSKKPKKNQASSQANEAKKSGAAILKKLPGGKVFWVLFLLLSLSISGWFIFGNKGLYHLYQLRQEREQLLQANLTLKDENDRLVNIIDRLQHDQEFIEDTIRKELHYIKKNEIIYQLEPEVGSGPKVTQAPALGPLPAAKSKRSGH